MLILDQGTAPGLQNLAAAVLAVLAHTGQHHRQHVSTIEIHRGFKHDIHGRTAKVHRLGLGQLHARSPGVAGKSHMEVARRQINMARSQHHAFRSLLHSCGSQFVQTGRQLGGKHGGHVLSDDHRHRHGTAQPGNDLGQSLGTTGGGAENNDTNRLVGHTGAVVQFERTGKHGRYGRDIGPSLGGQTGGHGPHRPNFTGQQAQNDGNQLFTHALNGLLDGTLVRRFRHVVRSTGRQGFQSRGRAALGQGGEHDDRVFAAHLAQLPHGIDAVHFGHFDVHSDGIGLQLFPLHQRQFAVRGSTHNLQVRVGVKRVCHDFTHYNGIVHHEDFNA